MVSKLKTYKYINMENEVPRYFCLQQNLFLLSWILFLEKDTLNPVVVRSKLDKFALRLMQNVKNRVKFFKKNLIFILVFARYKYGLRDNDSFVQVPIYGHMCIQVHKGYKVFNYRKRSVVKIFNKDVDKYDIIDEIKHLKEISQLDFASSLRGWNIDERWYEEDFINGSLEASYKPLDSKSLLEKYNNIILHHMNSLVETKQPIKKKVLKYVKEIEYLLDARRLQDLEMNETDLKNIRDFLFRITRSVNTMSDSSVFLVFSHGDFCPANMLNTRHGIRVIDWENSKYRSVLFDFYSYFFYRPVCRDVSAYTTVLEIAQALPSFIIKMSEYRPDISNSLLSGNDIYRWLYYIEEICKLMERSVTDTRLDIADFILRYINAFYQYEQYMSSESDKLTQIEN